MPLYEYECQQCHRRTEKIQKFSDPELTVCPHCGGVLQRTITAPAIQFKGAGWYKDLYSSAKPQTAGSAESAGAAPAGGDSGATPAPAAAKSESAAPPAAPAASSPSAPSGSGT